jgi:hypothetical protein
MASLIRTPKSAGNWTHNELRAYNITIDEQDPALFFGTGELPEPNCPLDFLHNSVTTPSVDGVTDKLLWNLDDAAGHSGLGETSVDLFAYALFEATGFTSRRIHPSVRRPLQLLIGGEERSAQTDVCLVYDRTVLLLVQEDKAEGRPPGRAEAQLVAEAIAARQYNTLSGTVDKGAEEVVPAILMVGTYPTFYKVPVSAALDTSVASLTYPTAETVVARCSPRVPRYASRYADGMRPLDSRAVVLQYLEAFRRYVFIPCSEATLGTRLDLSP